MEISLDMDDIPFIEGRTIYASFPWGWRTSHWWHAPVGYCSHHGLIKRWQLDCYEQAELWV
jgi:hypothetical protein